MRLKNIKFLNKNGIIHHYRTNGGNVVIANYLGDTFYIGLQQFKFRKAKTNNWIQKTHRIFGLDDVVKMPRGVSVDKKFRNKKVRFLIDNYPNEVEEFLYNAPVLFKNECIEYLHPTRDLTTQHCYKFIMPFGKYQSLSLEQILEIDKNYLNWVLENVNDKDYITNKIKLILE